MDNYNIGWNKTGDDEWVYMHDIEHKGSTYACTNVYRSKKYVGSDIHNKANSMDYVANLVDNKLHLHPADTRMPYVNNVYPMSMVCVGSIPDAYIYQKGKLLVDLSYPTIRRDSLSSYLKEIEDANRCCDLNASDLQIERLPPDITFTANVFLRSTMGYQGNSFEMLYRDKILKLTLFKNPSQYTFIITGIFKDMYKSYCNIIFEEGGMLVKPNDTTGVTDFTIPYTEGECMLNDESLSEEDKFMLCLENGSIPWGELEDLLYILKNTPKVALDELQTSANSLF